MRRAWMLMLAVGSASIAGEAFAQYPPPVGFQPAPIVPYTGPQRPPPGPGAMQVPFGMLPNPQPMRLPPLMYVRLAGPKGMKVTLFRGEATGRTFDTPAVVGLRPGYAYRVMLTDIPGQPGVAFFPTIEARGSLLLASPLNAADYPASIVFSADDLTSVEAGTLLTRMVVLERPDTAIPRDTTADNPIELSVSPLVNLWSEANDRGKPLVPIHLGQRKATAEELAASAVPGTILFPGEKNLAMPVAAPQIPFACWPVLDPILGPENANNFVKIPDGGDIGVPAGIDRRTGRIVGLDPTDTVAKYTDSKGREKLAVSNRVGVCVPRYILLRHETALAMQGSRLTPGAARVAHGFAEVNSKKTISEADQRLALEQAGNKIRPSGAENVVLTSVTGKVQNLRVTAQLKGPAAVDVSCPPPETPAAADRPLLIIKWPDKRGANIGDLVTFTLKYTNQGGQPITNIVVTDSLATRFAYVAGSTRTDREATFTVTPNEAGSSTLRWEFPGSLLPNESGLITFQVRIR
ncbi:MAG: DUF11 domain-containing protein [Gemmataceae bacterium]